MRRKGESREESGAEQMARSCLHPRMEEASSATLPHPIGERVMSYESTGNHDPTKGMEEDRVKICCSSGHDGPSFASQTRPVLKAINSGVKGCIDDAIYNAVDQVCNAFTLQETDIQAVVSRIHNASKQLLG